MPLIPVKIMLRCLPPDVTHDVVNALLCEQFPEDDSRPHLVYLETGKVRDDKSIKYSRCCLECPCFVDEANPHPDTTQLMERLSSLSFRTEAGLLSADVSVPPYPKLPRSEEYLGLDPRDGTIDTDPDFKKFSQLYENLVAAQAAGKPANFATLRDLPLTVLYAAHKVEAPSSPAPSSGSALVQYLVDKKLRKRAENKAKAKRQTAKPAAAEGPGPKRKAEREPRRPPRGKHAEHKDTTSAFVEGHGAHAPPTPGRPSDKMETPDASLAAAFKAALATSKRPVLSAIEDRVDNTAGTPRGGRGGRGGRGASRGAARGGRGGKGAKE